jgi:hypothetical protein
MVGPLFAGHSVHKPPFALAILALGLGRIRFVDFLASRTRRDRWCAACEGRLLTYLRYLKVPYLLNLGYGAYLDIFFKGTVRLDPVILFRFRSEPRATSATTTRTCCHRPHQLMPGICSEAVSLAKVSGSMEAGCQS